MCTTTLSGAYSCCVTSAPSTERSGSWIARRPVAVSAVVVVLASAGPWSWFMVRDEGALIEWMAILLPLVGLVGLALLGLVARVARSRRVLLVAPSWVAFLLVAVVGPWTVQEQAPPVDPVTLSVANLRGDNDDATALGPLLESATDVLVVLELTPISDAATRVLERTYPYLWSGTRTDGVAVWSRYPLDGGAVMEDGSLDGARGGRVVVEAPGATFALYALHLYRPSRHAFGNEVTVQGQRTLVDALVERMSRDVLPVVVAGDLNATDRGSAYRRLLGDGRDAARSTFAAPTSLRTRNLPLLLRIDHVFIPGDWCAADAERVGIRGSDHRAVRVEIGRCS